uniref:Uncharacterized protein n=1 Tax=Sinocyclocheilus anshuiensis TaxID=1608454 RepID=A0A671KIL6_9TELE
MWIIQILFYFYFIYNKRTEAHGEFAVMLSPWFLCRNEDLKEMLESNKESLKLEAMKRIVGVCHSERQ